LDLNNPAMPLVSIIIPCYNAYRWIGETINSCLAQTYTPIEIIIVDDGSINHSLDILARYGSQIRVEAIAHQGGCTARNHGFAVSSGRYILFLDSDDLIAPPTVSAMVDALSGKDNSVVACPWRHFTFSNGQWTPLAMTPHPIPYNGDYFYSWLTGWFAPPCALMWTRDVIDELNGWDETLTANQDGDLMFRALLHGVTFIPIEKGEALYRQHQQGEHISVGRNVSPISVASRFRVLEKVEQKLTELNRLHKYALPLSRAYHTIAVGGFGVNDAIARECVRHAKRLAGARAINGSLLHSILCLIIGPERKSKLATSLANYGLGRRFRLRRKLKS